MATLLAQRHQDHAPLGARHVLADQATAREMLNAALDGGIGYVATDGAAVLGFLVAPSPQTRGPTTARLGMACHAALAGSERSVYRLLYEAASADLVRAGITHHSLPLLTDHTATVQTFFELEFGIDQIDGIVAIPADAGGLDSSTRVRPAEPADVGGVVELARELQRYHSRAPMFQPAVDFDVQAIRRGATEALDDERSTVVVVEGDDGLLAMAQVGPASAYIDTADIGMNMVTEGARSRGAGTAMLQSILNWAGSHRYRYCTVGWTASNIISDSFYRSRGFAPVRVRLHRLIDPRISSANEQLDHGVLGHRQEGGH